MKDLVRTALVGTANAPHDASTLAEIDALLPEGSREQRLLLQAGSLAVYSGAGRLPRTAKLPVPAPDEVERETPAVLTPLIASAIADEIPGLSEWLAPRVAQAGYRLPPALLPDVLGKTTALPYWHGVLGGRGRWLASQNPGWDERLKQLAPSSRDEAALLRIWEEGGIAARVEALRGLRSIDAARARDMLAGVLPKEKADPRQQLVNAMAANLGIDDEPFLESLLDDRAQTVRMTAADLLARLPGSAFMRRMTARADACVRWQAATPASGAVARFASFLGKHGDPVLTVEIPSELPKDWARDGIVDGANHGEGKRASWLRQVLSLIPPARWSEAASSEAEVLIPLMAGNDWADSLLSGCATAACRAGDPAWAAAFLRFALGSDKPSPLLGGLIPALWDASLPVVCESELCRQLALGEVERANAFARRLDAPWPTEVVRTFARTFFSDAKQSRKPADLMLRYDLAGLARLAILRAADADLALLSPVVELYAGWLGNVFAGQPRMLEQAREIVALMQAKQTVIKEMPL
ncbi:hypothetical protein GQ57_00715 [Burkholderia sp. MSh2]|uniref:Uncharacterized protein n=1 Tax=Burkholderia paludis TaxID=1506587 RepID=A0A6J5D9U6_9BURK|nr:MULTISPECIES: DUF5691 domain-containing protein [Burkholderia]KEZ07630.1 hypothetical protein GQ57_00715 [Burkholderia sp. MSh2]CAB3749725.1 hypothetical protein LMG30113_01050 [Burkholderia paludis]VWB15726.1 hypothetical protein BPA30113_00444 [Burkholderia paludis]